jgi:hypothetical protein
MDPKAVLSRIESALLNDDLDELFDALEDLECWLDKEGFMTDELWLEFPMATVAYQEYIRELTYN